MAELARGAALSPEIERVAALAGGLGALDDALRGWIDRRDPSTLDRLPAEAAQAVRTALLAGRASRLNPRIVPKVGARTLGIDLYD